MQTRLMRTVQSVTLALTLLLSMGWVVMGGMGSARAEDGGDLKKRGLVEERPVEGFIGTWKIAGVSIVADAATEIDDEDGALTVGACAEAEYVKDGEMNKATRIQSKEAIECNETATVTTTPSPDESETETETPVSTAIAPTKTPTGTVQPTKTPTPRPTMQPLCERGDDDAAQASSDGDKCKTFGRITSFPASGFAGIWGIGTISYTVNNETELRTKHGMFVLDACVKVEFKQAGSERIAKKIETDRTFKCEGNGNGDHDDDDHDNGQHRDEMFGIVESFPISLTGEWKVGGMAFVATKTTEFKQEKGSFEISGTVKIKFWTDVNEVNHALKIETKFKKPAHHDDDHDGEHHGAEGMAVGKIEAMSSTMTATMAGTMSGTLTVTVPSTWTIAGIDYLVNGDTKLVERNGVLKVGVFVRVRYHLNASGARVADKIKTIGAAAQPKPGEDTHLAGFIEMMPTDGFSGTWTIAGVTFETTTTTRFEEERGALAVGSYVLVEYKVKNGANVIAELKTMVPPGAGDNNDIGKIEQSDDDNAVNSAGVAVNSWVVGGKTYLVNDATVLDDDAGSLAVGSSALVNSFTDATGNQVATRIETVVLSNQVFLPTVRR